MSSLYPRPVIVMCVALVLSVYNSPPPHPLVAAQRQVSISPTVAVVVVPHESVSGLAVRHIIYIV